MKPATRPFQSSLMRAAIAGALLTLGQFHAGNAFAETVGDDFNDGVVDPSKWGPDIVVGNSVVNEFGILQRLEYHPSEGGPSGVIRPWILNGVPCDSDWEIQMDTFNPAAVFFPGEFVVFGIFIQNPNDTNDAVGIGTYALREPATGRPKGT